MSAEVWGVVVAFAGVIVAVMAVGVFAFFWLLSAIRENGREFREEIRALRAEIQAESKERRAEVQRFFEILYRHRHDDGGAIYLPGGGDD